MKEVIININGELKTLNVSLVFASRNPKTNQFSISLSYSEFEQQKWIRLFCEEEETDALISGIREGNLTDLRQYKAQEVI
ncbi:hypothetical protein HCJ74_01320 [Listeria welshimeri]|nr:hypothetical protein [Listeria welshimeri]